MPFGLCGWEEDIWAPVQVLDHGRERERGTVPREDPTYVLPLLTCGKCFKIVTIFELPIFIQKVLWLKCLWIREFLLVKQEGVQGRNYNRALEGTNAGVSEVTRTWAFHRGSQQGTSSASGLDGRQSGADSKQKREL